MGGYAGDDDLEAGIVDAQNALRLHTNIPTNPLEPLNLRNPEILFL